MTQKNIKLGEMLIQAGKLNAFQLNSALSHQRNWGGRLGASLLSLGYISEQELLKFLATQLKLPRVNLVGYKISKEVLHYIPAEKALELNVLPVERKDVNGTIYLLVAMCDPTNLMLLDSLQFMTGCRIKAALASEREVREAINFHYYGAPAPVEAPQAVAVSAPMAAAGDESYARSSYSSEGVEVIHSQTLMTATENKSVSIANLSANAGLDEKYQALLRLLLDKGVLSLLEFDRLK